MEMRSGGRYCTNRSWICAFFHAVFIEARFIGVVVCLQTVELQKLILAHNDIELLKEDLRNLTSLVVLNLSHNKLTQLPAAIGEYVILPVFNMQLFRINPQLS